MKTRTVDIIVALIAILVGIGTLLLLPSQISQETIAAIMNTNSPAFFPIVSAFLIILCGLVLLLKTITLGRSSDKHLVLIPHPWFFTFLL
jgi:hypothetical protein